MNSFVKENINKAERQENNISETQEPVHPSEFRYTNDCNRLSREQRIFYEVNGYIVIPKLVHLNCLEAYKKRFCDLCEYKVKVPQIAIVKDVSFAKEKSSEKVVNRIQNYMLDEVLFEYCKLPQILDYAKCFCGPNIKTVHYMVINKPPDAGTLSSRHPLHQDLLYFDFRPADKIVCSWTAIDKANRENGCLSVIPGSHRGELLQHGYPNWENGINKLFHGILDLDESEISKRVHLEMEPGDTIFFHPLLFHGSGANRTDGFRKSISCHFASTDCYDIDVTGTNQEPLFQEYNDIAKKKGMSDADLKKLLSSKVHLVCGNEV